MIQISMRIDQNFMEEEVIKPIVKRLTNLEATLWVMKNNIALLTKEIKKEKDEEIIIKKR